MHVGQPGQTLHLKKRQAGANGMVLQETVDDFAARRLNLRQQGLADIGVMSTSTRPPSSSVMPVRSVGTFAVTWQPGLHFRGVPEMGVQFLLGRGALVFLLFQSPDLTQRLQTQMGS